MPGNQGCCPTSIGPLQKGESGAADPGLIDLLRRSQELEAASQGYFNPAIGGLISMWGFHTSHFPVHTPPPDQARIQAWLEAAPTTADISIRDGRLYSENPAVQLDFGAIAKGYAVDVAIRVLAEHGVTHAIVNAGGDLRARGRPDSVWRVGISDPDKGVLAALEVAGDEAVFTSGTSQRFMSHEGKRYPHVLSPKTGHAVQGLQSATVIAPEGVVADAAATALLVAGPEHWREVADSMGIAQALVIDEQGAVHVTAAMDARLEWAPNAESRKRIVN